MNIVLIAHDSKKELMEAFCTAYKHILQKHTLFATGRTGTMIEENVGLRIKKVASGETGEQQIAAKVAYNEMDLVVFFRDNSSVLSLRNNTEKSSLRNLCDMNNIPFATNIATAEVLILGLERGDLAWRELVNPAN